MKTIPVALAFALVSSLTVSCLVSGPAVIDETVCVRVNCLADQAGVKSIFSSDEKGLGNWCAMAYDTDGNLCAAVRSEDGCELKLLKNKAYKIYAVGNLGIFDVPDSESELLKSRYSISRQDSWGSGFPMSGSTSGYESYSKNSSITIFLNRAVARYDLLIDSSELVFSRFELTSVAVKQSALDVMLFRSESIPEKVGDWDCASESDVRALGKGEKVSFYMLENCGGRLLEGNTDQWKKVPGSLGPEKEMLTYLELQGRWLSSGISSDITLRMYLGRDNCSDFNVDRNTVNTVQLTLSDEGLLQSDWRIFRSNIDDSRVLEFEEQEIELVSGSPPRRVGINVSPYDVAFSVAVNRQDLDDAGVSYTLDKSAIRLSSDYQGAGTPSVTFYLKTWDGVIKGSLKADVRVPTPYDISGIDGSYLLPQGNTRWPDVVFNNGVPSRAELKFTSSDNSVAKFVWDSEDDDNPLGISPLSPGFATLTITYGSFSKTVYVYVTPDYSLTGLPDKYVVIDQGEKVDYVLATSANTVIPGQFYVETGDAGIMPVVSKSVVEEKDFTKNGVNFGNFSRSLKFSLYGASNGKTRLECRTDYPIKKKTMNAYTIGPGKTAVIRISPTDGSASSTLTSTGKTVVYNVDNNVGCNVLISGDAVITAVKFSRSESTAYHSDMSLSERCTVSLCGKSYSVGQTITDLDDLNSGEAFYIKGYDSIIEIQICVGRSSELSTLKMFFLNE